MPPLAREGAVNFMLDSNWLSKFRNTLDFYLPASSQDLSQVIGVCGCEEIEDRGSMH
jgi:hypothetical protein